MKRYSLANYILSIDSSDAMLKSMFGTISIGGEGSYLGSVNISQSTNMWTTKGFATGAWVQDKNLDRTGTVQISLQQLADTVQKLIRLFNVYYTGNYGGSTITVSDVYGNKVATCTDCYIQKAADQNFGETSVEQSWTFTCGKIAFG